jgi:hypothetical protein
MKNYWDTNNIAMGPHPGQSERILYWETSDSLENFKQRTDNLYTETSITYEHNSYGYRCKEFEFNSTRPSIICVGCSFTYGTGLPVEDTWVSRIAEQYPDYHVYNFGFPGGSGDLVVRTLWSIGEKLNTKIVCILWPEIYRYEIYHGHCIENILIGHEPHQKFFIPEMLNNTHFDNLRYKNQALLNLLVEKYQWRVIENSTAWVVTNNIDNGRDIHSGPQTNKLVADYFISNIG